MSRSLLLVVLFVAGVFCDPARPNLHETFESRSSATIRRGAIHLSGTGTWAVDQPHGMAVEHIRFHNGSDHFQHNVEIVQRYDQSTQYEVIHEGTVAKCHKTPLTPPMHTTWSWVKDATYKGTKDIRHYKVDLWELSQGGVILQVGVNTTNANHPVYYSRKTSSELFELHFATYHHRQANISAFAVPKVCQTQEDGWVTKEPVFETRLPDNFVFRNLSDPNGLAQVLSCASVICNNCCPYVWGGNGPCCPGKSGYDCSGLTNHCYLAGGYLIPRTAAEQQKAGKACTGSLQAGDLLFFGNPAHHVVMYSGLGLYECPHTGANCHHTGMRSYDGGCRRFG